MAKTTEAIIRQQRAKARALAAIPVEDRIPARALCDIQWLIESGADDAEIARRVNLPPEKVTQIITEGGLRDLIGSEAEKSRDEKMRLRWTRAVGLASRSLSLAGLKMAGEAADKGDAFGFSLAARGTKAFVDMARQADGLDGKDGSGAGAPSVNMFFFAGEALPIKPVSGPAPKDARAAQAINVAATEAAEADELGFA